jgi:hypothetical protein
LVAGVLALATVSCGERARSTTTNATGSDASAEASVEGGVDAAGIDAAVSVWPPVIDPAVFGHGDVSKLTVAAFSQTGVAGPTDPQVLSLVPDVVPRAWSQWKTSGILASDYTDGAYPQACEAAGITFIGGLTASVLFPQQWSAADFADEVGRDATNQQVAHDEIVMGAFRGALASPGFRAHLVAIAELQIDQGVDGLFFDEVNASYVGAGSDGDEGFDDHDVADFGRYLCSKHSQADLDAFGVTAADHLDCAGADPGAGFDYRGFMARIGVSAAPLSTSNPLAADWGTTVQNRPNPAAGTFVESGTSLVYWQDVVKTVRAYARSKYGKEILITSNGIFPFVDFQTVGLYDYNIEGSGPMGFDYVPTVEVGTETHFKGTQQFMPVFAALKARSDALMAFVGGPPVPLLLFLDWPTASIDRYYALPLAERQDYVRVVLAEAYALGESFALPLATTTDTSTATVLGMMDFFAQIRAFYDGHADRLRPAKDATVDATVSAPNVASHVTTLPDGRTVVHLVNHNYDAGFVAQAGVTVTLPTPQAPSTVTVASPDQASDADAAFTYAGGSLTVTVGQLVSSAMVVVR